MIEGCLLARETLTLGQEAAVVRAWGRGRAGAPAPGAKGTQQRRFLPPWGSKPAGPGSVLAQNLSFLTWLACRSTLGTRGGLFPKDNSLHP